MLTPLLTASLGASLAVAAVSLPHAVATAVRCWRLRAHIAFDVLKRFGLLSAVGGLAGALLYTQLGPSVLGRVLGALLLMTAVAQWTGMAKRWRPVGPAVSMLGLASGLCGGVAGNQGGIRAAALASFGLGPRAFVATATATALLVDVARTPVYLWQAGNGLRSGVAADRRRHRWRAGRHLGWRACAGGLAAGAVLEAGGGRRRRSGNLAAGWWLKEERHDAGSDRDDVRGPDALRSRGRMEPRSRAGTCPPAGHRGAVRAVEEAALQLGPVGRRR